MAVGVGNGNGCLACGWVYFLDGNLNGILTTNTLKSINEAEGIEFDSPPLSKVELALISLHLLDNQRSMCMYGVSLLLIAQDAHRAA